MLPAAKPRRLRFEIFSAASDERYRRRAVDAARFFFALVLVALVTAHAGDPTRFEDRLSSLIESLPSVGDTWWRAPLELALAYAALLIVVCLAARRRYRLVLELLLAGAGAWVIGIGLGALVDGAPLGLFDVSPAGSHPSYPVLRLAVIASILATAHPHLSRSFRRLSHVMVAGATVGAMLLTLGRPIDALGGLALGWGVAAAVHLALGAPGGHPTVGRVTVALRDLGIEVDRLMLAPSQPWGSTTMVGDDGGPLLVRVYGRDATDAQVLAKAWRFAQYRDSGPTLTLTRLQQVEHEAYVTLLAAHVGVATPEVVTSGRSVAGDALVAFRIPCGLTALADLDPSQITDRVLECIWIEAERLHAARIAHGALNATNLLVGPEARVTIVDFTNASSSAATERLLTDRAELLVSTALLVGEKRALDAALHGAGREALTATLPFVQAAALTPGLRHLARASSLDISHLRKTAADALGVDLPHLEHLRRVSGRNVLMVVATGVAAFVLISQLGDVDLAQVADDLENAEWGWILAALLTSQATNFPGAAAMLGAVGRPVPLWPLLELQFATAFTNLVLPSTVGRAAVEIRFFQKVGIPPARAVTQGVSDSVGGFLVQISLLLTALLLGSGGSFHLDNLGGGLGGHGWLILLGIFLVAVAIVVVLEVSAIRRRVVPQLRTAKDGLRDVLSSPRNIGLILGGNLGSQLLFATTLVLCAHAYGQSVSLWDAVLVNTVTTLFAGLVPIPGGMGVAEGTLTAGLIAVGVPDSTAFTIAITHRLLTYYLPPLWGWVAFRNLVRNDYL